MVGVDSFGSWRTKRAEERGRLFSRLPALTAAATGAAQGSLEASGSPSGRKAVLLKEQLLLARSLREWVLEEGRARFRGEECLRPAERGGRDLSIPKLTCVRRIRFALPRCPLPGAPKMSGETVLHEHLWDRSPFVCPVRGRREHKEQIVASTRAVYPGSGRGGRVKPYSCLVCIEWESSGA